MLPVRIGCSGWNYDDWRGRLYPEGLGKGRWLERYAEVFDTVEVNSTFYRLASREAVGRWVEQTPPEFVFAAKASRYLTHVRRLRERSRPGSPATTSASSRSSRPASSGRSCGSCRRTSGRTRSCWQPILPLLPAGRHCFEFRHESWFRAEIYDLLRGHGAALVIGDHPKWPFQARELTADWTLIRLHHGHRGRRGNYSESELDEWAGWIARVRRRAEVLVYFNNDWEGFAVANARSLKRRLRS